MSGSYKPPAKDIKQFISVTGAKRDVAISMLEACAGNVEMAIHMHLDTGAPQQATTSSSAASSSSHQSTSASSRSRSQAQASAAPMAADDVDDEEVRAPIPVRTEVLVGGPSLMPARRSRGRGPQNSPFNHMRDFQAEGLLNVGGVGPKGSGGSSSNLAHLFRPPTDIMFRGSLDTARAAGLAAGKWILCDIHDQQVFDCQRLNRDLWRHKDVRRILEDSFVFWQVQVDSIDGRRFQQFYSFDECPHIAFIDPRTGERLDSFGFVEHQEFCKRAEDFLSRHALPVAGLESEAHSLPAARSSTGCTDLGRNHRQQRATRHVGDVEEAAEMANAIAASLAPNGGGNSSMSSLHSDTSEDSDFSPAPSLPSPRRGRSRRAAATAQRIISSDEEEEDVAAGMRSRTRRKRKSSHPKVADADGGPSSESLVGRAKRMKTSSVPDAAVNSAASALAAASVRDHSACRATAKSRSRRSASPATPSLIDMAASKEVMDESASGGPTGQPTRPSPPSWSGTPDDRIVRVLFRLPDGSRQTCEPRESTTLQSLQQYVEHLGFPQSQFSLVTPCPRKQLSDLVPDTSSTLRSMNFFPSITLCIEEVDPL